MLASIKKMKWLNKKISGISKSVLLFSLLLGGVHASVISSDRFLLKILDRNVSLEDFNYQSRNLSGLFCIYDDAFIIQYFGKSFLKDYATFLKGFPKEDEAVRKYMRQNTEILKKLRILFKMFRYAEDQKNEVSPSLTKLIRDAVKANNCDREVLHKDTLKTNFITLIQLELYLRSRYGGQLVQNQNFEQIRPSLDLFTDSLDKQFEHEYYW